MSIERQRCSGVAVRLRRCGEVEDGGPLAFAMCLPDDFSVEEGCDFGWGEIAMEVEVLRVGGFVVAAEVELARGGCPLGGEDEGGVVAAGVGGGLLDLVEGEVLDGEGFDGVVGVAEFGAGELGGGGPCGEDGGLRVVLVDEADGSLVEDDHVAVGEVVFGGEGVGRVDPDAGEEGCGAEGGEKPPLAEVTLPGGDAEEEDRAGTSAADSG